MAAFRITITAEADTQLKSLPVHQQRLLESAIQSRLLHQPTVETRNIKKLRPNPLVAYELRAGDLRALYNVEGDEVILIVVGRKTGNKLLVKGEEFHGHQDDPPKPAKSKPQGDAR